MAKLYNLARMTTLTTGSGPVTLAAVVAGHISFDAAGVKDNDIVVYTITDGASVETGRGVYSINGPTLTRIVTQSSNSNLPLNLSGSAEVYISEVAGAASVVSGGGGTPASDHGLLSGLADDDHAQYVHKSAARTITAVHQFAPGSATAPFTLSTDAQGQTITGLKADQLNKTVTAGAGLTGGGALTASITLNVGAGNGITVNTDDIAVKLPATSGLTVDGTGLYLADSVAGAGLAISSKVLAVGAGNGIAVAADSVAVNLKTASGLEVDSAGLAIADAVAGAGLVIASKVLAVGAGNGITANADDITIKLPSPSGLTVDSTGLYLADSVAGAGLTIASKVLAVGAGNGVTVAADSVAVKLKTTSGLEVDSAGLALADTVAGAGLSVTNKVLEVGAGALISVSADSVSVSNGSAQWQVPITGASPFTPSWTALSSLAGDGLAFSSGFNVELSATSGLQLVGVSPAKTLEIDNTIAGAGLTIASKVLAVGAGTLISVGENAVSLAVGTAQYQIIVTGANPYTPAYAALSDFAGVGLNFTGGKFVLGTPSTLTAGTTNSSSGTTHSHAITASAAPGAAEYILKSTPAGGLTLESIAVNGAATVGQDLTVGANVLFVDQSAGLVGINCVPDPQFQLDVNSNIRARGYIVGKHAIQLKDAKLIAHFDGPEPFETNFTGEATGHMGQVATLTGGVIFPRGKFNKGVQVAEATTNLVTNPSLETNTTGWNVSNASITRIPGGVYGSYCGEVITTGASSGYAQIGSISVAAGASVTFSAYVKATNYVTTGTHLGLIDATNNVTRANATLTASNEWQRLMGTWTNDTGGAVNVAIRVRNAAINGTETVWFDAVQAEAKTYATPFCDGSLGAGHTWSGTEHLSTSSRTIAAVTYAKTGNIDLDEGAVSLWFYEDGTTKNDFRRLFLFYIDTNNRIALNAWSTANTPYAFSVSGGTAVATSTGATASVVGWNHVVATWKTGGQLKVYLNGVASGATPSYTAPIGTGGTLYIGCDAGTSHHLNDLIDDLVIVGRELSADEIRAIYESDAPVFAESSTWQFKSSSQLVWADAEGLWAMDADGNPAFGVSGVDGKSWGGNTLDKGDILMGRASNYLKWDASAGLLSLYSPGSTLTQEEYFDGSTAEVGTRWANYGGSGSYTITTGGQAGGNLMRIGDNSGNDQMWLISNQSIPFDPNKLYRVFVRARRVAGASARFYAGIAGRDATDTVWVNVAGANEITSQYYIAANNETTTIPVVGEGGAWTEYTGYFRGVAASGNGGKKPLASAPATLHTDVRYFRLMLLVNFSAQAGITEVDEIRVDVMPNYSDSPFAHATDTTTIDGGKIYTGSITADKITTATLAAITADLGAVTAGSIVVGSTNKLWLNDAADGALAIGGTVKGSAPFRVTAAGVLTATSGTVGGWSLGAADFYSAGIHLVANAVAASNKIYVGTGTYNSSDTAFYVDGSGQFSLKNKLTWDGSTLAIDGTVTAAAGTIGGWTLAAGSLSATNAILDSTSKYFRIGATPASMTFGSTDGIQIEYNGGNPRAYIGNGSNRFFSFDGTNISWQGASTSLTTGGLFTAANANITGAITANSGSIAGNFSVGANLSIGTGGSISSGATAYNTGTGFWLEYNAGTPRLFLGTAAGNKLTWDGSALAIVGNVTASAGTIGGWSLAAGAIWNTNILLSSNYQHIRIGATPSSMTFGASDGIMIEYNNGDPRFYVGNGSTRYVNFDGTDLSFAGANTSLTTAGLFTASNANITGTIDANAGYLGSLTVDGTLTISTGGKLLLGTAATGITIGDISGSYYIRGTNTSVTQFEVRASDGKLYAGAGAVRLDANGLSIDMADMRNGVKWYTTSAFSTQIGEILVQPTASVPEMALRVGEGGAITTQLLIGGGYAGVRAANIYLNKSDGDGGVFVGTEAGGFTRTTTFVPLATALTNTSWDGDSFSTTSGDYKANTAFSALPSNVKAIAVRVAARDSGSASSTTAAVTMRARGGTSAPLIARPAGLANDCWAEQFGIVPLDSSGYFTLSITATGTSTLDLYIQVYGYFL